MAKFLLDSADIEEIKKWLFYIDGITTNPILLEKAGITAIELYGKLAKIGLKNFKFFIQVADKPVHKNLIPSEYSTNIKVIYKVPLVLDEYEYIRFLKVHGKIVAGTMTYDIIQLQTAINLGVSYCIVLYHKNSSIDFPWNAATLKQNTKPDVKLIGASFRRKDEVVNAIIDGMDYVTVPPRVMEECFYNEQAQGDYDKIYT